MLPSNACHADSRSPPEPAAGPHHDIRVQMRKRTQSTFNWNHMFLIEGAAYAEALWRLARKRRASSAEPAPQPRNLHWESVAG